MNYRLSALALGATLLVGCASSSSGDRPQGRSDPLEGFNRTMFNFNFNVVDPYVLRPVAVAWRDYVPQPARNGLSNFTSNLEEPEHHSRYGWAYRCGRDGESAATAG